MHYRQRNKLLTNSFLAFSVLSLGFIPPSASVLIADIHPTSASQDRASNRVVRFQDETSSGQDAANDERPAEPATDSRLDRLDFSGDFRSRYEGFYKRTRPTRNRARMRLRLRLDAKINEDATFHMQVASGDPGTPASTNQTFTQFFQPKPFNLDRAFVSYNPKAASAVTLGIGKFPTPVMRTQMTFDDDLNFEGGWEQLNWQLRAGVDVALGAIQTAVKEASRGADSYMLGGYGAVSFGLGRHNLQLSAANYAWGNVDLIATAQASGDLTSILTNRIVRNVEGNIIGFASRFNVIDVVTEVTLETPKHGYPLRLLADYAINTRATNDRNQGFWVEVGYGDPGPTGTWGVTYTHGWVEQDVSPSAFVFSDMPGTNLRLNMIETSYVLKTGFSLDVTAHSSKRLFVLQEHQPNQLLTRLHVAVVARF